MCASVCVCACVCGKSVYQLLEGNSCRKMNVLVLAQTTETPG